MKKYFSLIVFGLLLTLFLNQSFAEQENLSLVLSSKKIVSQVSKEGEATKGVTFVTHDIYYDGYLFLFNVTMLPNEDGFCVVNDVLGNYESFPTETVPSDLPLIGAYFEIGIADEEGQNVGNHLLGKGEYKGNAYTKTFAYSFPLDGKNQI